MDKIEIIIRHTSAGQTQQFYGVNHYEPDEALRRFHAISTEADEMHWRMLQDSEIEPSPTTDLLDALKDMLSGWRYIRQDPAHKSIYGVGWDRAQNAAEAAIAKAKRRDA